MDIDQDSCTNSSLMDIATPTSGAHAGQTNSVLVEPAVSGVDTTTCATPPGEATAKPENPPQSTLPTPETLEPSVTPRASPPLPASKASSRFSVNISGVGLPAMASNLGLTQANGERAADMAQDLKKNVVNMWNTWFTAPPSSTTSSASSSTDGSALKAPISGTQSLSQHQQRPAKTQRMNSYTLGSKAGGDSASALGSSLSSPPSPRGYSLDIPDRKANKSPLPSSRHDSVSPLPQPVDKSTTIVHEANDPIAKRSSTCVAPPPNVTSAPIYLMGRLYAPSSTQWTDFQRDFTLGMIWCTYRHGYAPIKPSNFTSDVGWGCMLRSGQGLLANALAIQFMGRSKCSDLFC